MATNFKTLMTAAMLLLVTHCSFAGPTEDLWTALKSANYPNALTAIAAGADVKSTDPAFGTPLNFASCWADTEVVKALIDAKSDVNFSSPLNGNTPLINAAQWGNIGAVKLLLAAGADVKIKNKIGQPMLSACISSDKLEVLKLLVNAGADPNEKYTLNGLELNLMNALIGVYPPKDKIANVKSIGANLSKLNVTFPPRLANAQESDYSPLEDLTRYLLEKGANPNQEIKGGAWGCILNQACEFGKTGIVKALIDSGADVNNTKGPFDATPLVYACQKNHADIVQLLINAKAKLETISKLKTDKEGMWITVTPLCIAAINGSNECVEALCNAGANVNYVSVKTEVQHETSGGGSTTYYKVTLKNTAATLANGNGHPDTAEILIKHGARSLDELTK